MTTHIQTKSYEWAIVGAGPAGLTAAGLLLDAGISGNDIIMIDPTFTVGDFGNYWGEVYSNTTVENFIDFLSQINAFNFCENKDAFELTKMPEDGYCQLQKVTKPLQWITNVLQKKINVMYDKVTSLRIDKSYWQLQLAQGPLIQSKKVILATGSLPKSLRHEGVDEISLYDALNPNKLKLKTMPQDTVAVFGSSHSSMIIIKNLLDAGVKNVINFYLTPHRYAVKMDGWTLYDNTGLKGLTAEWVHKHISKHLDPRIKRFISNEENIQQFMPTCNKAIYPIGFKVRQLNVDGVDINQYDPHTGIIAPGLFGTGIAFPQVTIDPFGNKELNVGLYKFMSDMRKVLPIWQRYDI